MNVEQAPFHFGEKRIIQTGEGRTSFKAKSYYFRNFSKTQPFFYAQNFDQRARIVLISTGLAGSE